MKISLEEHGDESVCSDKRVARYHQTTQFHMRVALGSFKSNPGCPTRVAQLELQPGLSNLVAGPRLL